jgi:apolipoprotein N-acyltransferase
MLYFSAFAAALLLAFALPNEFALYGQGLLGFFCLSPYFAALGRTRSYGEAARVGFVFGIVAHGASSYWLLFFNEFALWTLGLTTLVYGFFHAVTALFLRRAALLKKSPFFALQGAEPGRALRPFLLALVWTLWEYIKSTGFLGYPWGLVPYSLNNYPRMIQIADITGIYGLSFLLALSSAVLAELFQGITGFPALGRVPRTRLFRRIGASPALPGMAAGGVLFLWFSLYGAFRLAHPVPVQGYFPMLLVQHNANSWTEGELRSLEKTIRLSREGLRRLRQEPGAPEPGLLVWSETVLVRPFEEFRLFFNKNPPGDPLIPFLQEAGIPLLTGAPEVHDWEPYTASNSAILIEKNRIRSSYAKQHLVPFAEAIPFIEFDWMRSFMSAVVGLDGGWVMGTKPVIMEAAHPKTGNILRFAVPICFEDAFAPLCAEFFRQGADLLINLTNDSWSQTVSAEIQHLAAARFRTVENRRVLVRSTNGGISCVIDAEGKIAAAIPPFTEAVLSAEVPIQKAPAPTAYAILGDWVPLLCGALFLAWLVRHAGKAGRETVI